VRTGWNDGGDVTNKGKEGKKEKKINSRKNAKGLFEKKKKRKRRQSNLQIWRAIGLVQVKN